MRESDKHKKYMQLYYKIYSSFTPLHTERSLRDKKIYKRFLKKEKQHGHVHSIQKKISQKIKKLHRQKVTVYLYSDYMAAHFPLLTK